MYYDYCKAENEELMNAWNMFVDTGIVPTEYLRPEDDYTSWVRCSHQSIYRKNLCRRHILYCDRSLENCLISNSRLVMSYMDSMLAKILGQIMRYCLPMYKEKRWLMFHIKTMR